MKYLRKIKWRTEQAYRKKKLKKKCMGNNSVKKWEEQRGDAKRGEDRREES